MPPNVLAQFAGGQCLALAEDRPPELWDAATGQLRFRLDAPPRAEVEASAGARQFVAVRGHELRILDGETGGLVRPVITLEHSGHFPALTTNGQRAAVGYHDSGCVIYDTVSGRAVLGPLRHEADIRCAAFTPDGRILATGGEDRTLRLWDAATGEAIGPPLRHDGYVMHIAVRADGLAFVTGCSNGTARVWEIAPAPESPEEMMRLARRLNGRGE